MKKGHKMTGEQRKKMSLAKLGSRNPRYGKPGTCLGRKQTPEQIMKIKEARARQVITLEHRKNISLGLSKFWKSGVKRKEELSYWKGDRVGYGGLHKRVRNELGKPDTCEHCGRSGLRGQRIHWANKSGLYYTHMNDWLRLCVKCHRKYDREKVHHN